MCCTISFLMSCRSKANELKSHQLDKSVICICVQHRRKQFYKYFLQLVRTHSLQTRHQETLFYIGVILFGKKIISKALTEKEDTPQHDFLH